MKTNVVVFALALTASCMLVGCSDDDGPDTIYGSWDWRKSNGGFFPHEETPASTGHHYTFLFKEDGTYIQTMDGNVVADLTFKTGDVSRPDGFEHFVDLKRRAFVLDSHGQDSAVYYDQHYLYKLLYHQLILQDDVSDASTMYFARMPSIGGVRY